MNPADRWRTIEELYNAARQRPPEERAGFLAEACRGDAALQQDVESLLEQPTRSEGLLGSHGTGSVSDERFPGRNAQPEPTGHVVVGMSLGRFRIVERLGAGGMGEVYRAHDHQLNRPVAIKVLSPATLSDAAARARLIREARTASRLNHPNICTIYDAGESNGEGYIAMELVEGRSLHDQLKAGPFTPEVVGRYAVQLTHALSHAHERGIVHRDLKSANVVATRDGLIKVLDFGLAKRVDRTDMTGTTHMLGTITEAGTVVGTLAYMAPELLRGLNADPRSDIWALGVLLYEMAVGRLPFTGSTRYELTAAILHGPAAVVPPSLPAVLRETIERCLEREPADRFQSAAEIRRTLQGIDRATARTPTPRFGSRALAMMVGTAGVLIAVAATAFTPPIRGWVAQLFSPDVLAFAERDWLLVSSFENQTGDAVFDRTLDTALAVGMSQSSYVNLLPASRIEGALRRMKRTTVDNRLDGATAREIAQREGIKLVLVPAITELGGVYQLSGSLQDPATGTTLESAVVRATGRDQVLPAVDTLIGAIRRELGEASRSIAAQGRPLADVTTASLEALKVFSAANAAFLAGRVDESVTLLEDALRLDPTFTAARAQLGIKHFELRDRAKGRRLLEQAATEVDGLTERERLGVLALYARAIDQPAKATEYYKAALTMYPDDASVYNNLGRVYMQMERWEEAVSALKRALELDPDRMPTYYSLNEVYVDHLGELDAAIALSRQQIAFNDAIEFPYSFMGWALFGKGEVVQAREAYQKALAINPRGAGYLFRIGHAYRLEGRYVEARETFRKALAVDPEYYAAHYEAGRASRLMGDETAARQHFMQYRLRVEALIQKNPNYARPYLSLAMVLWWLDDRTAAEAAARRGLVLDPSLHYEKALFLALQDRHVEAIAALQRAVDGGFRDFVMMKIDFESLAGDPAFEAILTRGFRNGGTAN